MSVRKKIKKIKKIKKAATVRPLFCRRIKVTHISYLQKLKEEHGYRTVGEVLNAIIQEYRDAQEEK
jgi:hypothetical protein